jgi:hypothetical protein
MATRTQTGGRRFRVERFAGFQGTGDLFQDCCGEGAIGKGKHGYSRGSKKPHDVGRNTSVESGSAQRLTYSRGSVKQKWLCCQSCLNVPLLTSLGVSLFAFSSRLGLS